MNANYQRISIAATLIIFSILLATFFLRTPSRDDNAPSHTPTPNPSQPQSSPFTPFHTSEEPTPAAPKSLPTTIPPKTIARQNPPQQNPRPPQTPTPPENLPTEKPENLPTEKPENPSHPNNTPQPNPWAAQISPEELARIDAVIDAAEQRHQKTITKHADRQTALQTLDHITLPCFDELFTRAPDANGRIILNFEVAPQPNNLAKFENIHIASNYNLHDMTFESCIITTIQSTQIPSQTTDRFWAEHVLSTHPLP